MSTITERKLLTLEDVKLYVSRVSSGLSGIRMSSDGDYRFEVQELKHEDPSINGFLIRVGFWRPDANSGRMGEGFGRWMHVPATSDEGGVVKTAYVCIDLVVRHEMMEAFLYQGKRIFDPHKGLNDLAYPSVLPKD